MNMLETVVLVLHLLVAAAICGFVLLQHGKGADMGAAFGSGSSGSLFGAAGSANFLSRTTAMLATVFFVTSIALTYFGSKHGVPQGIMEKPGVMEQVVPAKPGDVPQAAPSTNAAPAPAPNGAATPAPGTAPADVPK